MNMRHGLFRCACIEVVAQSQYVLCLRNIQDTLSNCPNIHASVRKITGIETSIYVISKRLFLWRECHFLLEEIQNRPLPIPTTTIDGLHKTFQYFSPFIVYVLTERRKAKDLQVSYSHHSCSYRLFHSFHLSTLRHPRRASSSSATSRPVLSIVVCGRSFSPEGSTSVFRAASPKLARFSL